MSIPSTRDELKDWCLRKLGHPVIQINIDDDQLDDRVDEALQYFREFHFDGVERTYVKHQMTDTDIGNEYVTIPDEITGVTRVFTPYQGSTRNMFDIKYQLFLNDLPSLSSLDLSNYYIIRSHLSLMDMLINGDFPIRFNKHTHKLYIDWDWQVDTLAGNYIVMEAFAVVDPEAYVDVYNDRMFKDLATAMIKKQWGSNLKKFTGMQLPGGVQMSGQQIFDEAAQEESDIKQTIRDTFEEPPEFIVG